MIVMPPGGIHVSNSVPATDCSNAEAVRSALRRVLASEVFSNAPILSRFLRYVVEHRIGGLASPLKEYTIGVDVFQRGADFDPRVDTIVRVHARRLRQRLDRYYEELGRGDRLRITIPKGHYRAEIRPRRSAQTVPLETRPARLAVVAPGPGAWRRRFGSSAIPAPRTPLVGRAGEVVELRDMLTDADGPRLLSLTGTAGSGKTRLAIEVGLQWQEQLSCDAVFVRLASVPDAQGLQLALLRAFGLRALDDTPPIEVLCTYLHGIERAPPLILDNFEQLAEAAPLIGSLLDACISLKVLVTSRVALHLYGECEYPVLPLDLPGSDPMTLEELGVVPAVQLFVQRAAAVRPGFSLDADNAEAVSRLCRRFDGLPLGIELAAVQCRALAPAQILDHFPERLDLPAGNIADVPDRQRSLRHAIEWSHGLLDERERRVFRRLAVFSGGFTLEAAEAVANVRDDAGLDVAGSVARLLDNNLLQAESGPGEPRYAMLETIREYGLEQLAESGEKDEIRRAHAAYFLVLAEEGTGKLDGQARRQWLELCDREQGNFREALDGLVEHGDGEWALRLVRALYGYWERREYPAVALRAFLSVLGRFEPSTHPSLWAQVACCAGAVEGRMGRHEAADARLRRGLEVARECGDRTVEIMALNTLAVSENFAQRYPSAVALYQECLRLCETSGGERETAAALSNLAVAKLALGEHDEARGLLERALASFRHLEESTPAAWCLNQLGDAMMVAGRCAEAENFYQQSAQRFLQLGDFLGIARCWTDLGQAALLRGEYAQAASLFADALKIHVKRGSQRGMASLIEGCAALEVAQGRHSRGLVLAGAAEAVRAARKMGAFPYQETRLERALRPAIDALEPAQIEEYRRRGAAMNERQAIEYVERCLRDCETDGSEGD